ncbi:MAG: glycosyltransferase family 4 protein [Crocosphaera sp.]|nr:glycosyltransferase family 4 protein [Crocosphaera sp.]
MYTSLHSLPINLINLGNPQDPKELGISSKIWQKVNRLFIKQEFFKKSIARRFNQVIKEQLQDDCINAIVAPVACQEMQSLKTDIPIIYVSDVTHKLLVETYNLENNQHHEQCESSAILRAKKLVYSSQWAANSAIKDYGASPEKIEIIPFGANIDTIPDAQRILDKCSSSRCRLLFMGRDWERKGGKLAFDTLTSLLDMGVDAELLVLGCYPPLEYTHERLKVIPNLNKNISEEREQFNNLLLESHFLIFPTRADCSPIVICEANASGIPVITTDVGGIPSIIKNGKNGFMLSLSASGQDYAQLIQANFSDPKQYQHLVRVSRAEYEVRLNWQKWAEHMFDLLIAL